MISKSSSSHTKTYRENPWARCNKTFKFLVTSVFTHDGFLCRQTHGNETKHCRALQPSAKQWLGGTPDQKWNLLAVLTISQAKCHLLHEQAPCVIKSTQNYTLRNSMKRHKQGTTSYTSRYLEWFYFDFMKRHKQSTTSCTSRYLEWFDFDLMLSHKQSTTSCTSRYLEWFD